MALSFRPRFQFGYELESDFEPELPMFPWNRGRGGVGNSDTAASGVVESYKIRRDRILFLRLRILEHEMDAFDAFLDWAQDSGEPFNVWLDRTVLATEHSAYLNSLRWEDGPDFEHERDGHYRQLFVVDLELRTEDGSQWNTTWASLAIAAESES